MTIRQEILLGQVSQNQNNVSTISQNPHPLVIWSPTISAVVAVIAVVSQAYSVWLTIKTQEKSIAIQEREVKTLKESIKDQKKAQDTQEESLKIQRSELAETIKAQSNNLQIQEYNLYIQEKAIRSASLLEFNKRYDYIYFELRKKVENEEYPIQDYYIRFWTLQQDKYISWIQGFLDDDVYENFLIARRNEYFDKEKTIIKNGENYEQGFKFAKDQLAKESTKFFSFMFRILNETSIDIKTIMIQEQDRYETQKLRRD